MTDAKSILVVDDELFVRELLLEFLGQNGFSVFLADRGSRAIELSKERHYDMCLLDLKMPEMNGLEVLQEFEKIEEAPLTMLMTGEPLTYLQVLLQLQIRSRPRNGYEWNNERPHSP